MISSESSAHPFNNIQESIRLAPLADCMPYTTLPSGNITGQNNKQPQDPHPKTPPTESSEKTNTDGIHINEQLSIRPELALGCARHGDNTLNVVEVHESVDDPSFLTNGCLVMIDNE